MAAHKSTRALASFAATSIRRRCRTTCGRSSAGCCSIICASARSAPGCRGATGRAAMSVWSARAGTSHVLFSRRNGQSAARDVPQRHLRFELRRRRHPCRRDAASRHRGLVGGACGRRAHRRVGAGGAGRGRCRLRDHHPHRAGGAAQPFQARLPEHRHLRRLRHGGRRRAAAVSRQGRPRRRSPTRSALPAATPAGSRSSTIPAARPSASTRRTRPRAGFGGAAGGRGLQRAERHHRRAGRLRPRLCRRLQSGADRGRARPALPSDGRAGEVACGRRARRGRHRRHAGAARAARICRRRHRQPWRSASRRSSRAG